METVRCPKIDWHLQSCILGCHGNHTMSEDGQALESLHSWLLWKSYDVRRWTGSCSLAFLFAMETVRCPKIDRHLQSCVLGCHGNHTMSKNRQALESLHSWFLWKSCDVRRWTGSCSLAFLFAMETVRCPKMNKLRQLALLVAMETVRCPKMDRFRLPWKLYDVQRWTGFGSLAFLVLMEIIRSPKINKFLQSCALGCYGDRTMSEDEKVLSFALLVAKETVRCPKVDGPRYACTLDCHGNRTMSKDEQALAACTLGCYGNHTMSEDEQVLTVFTFLVAMEIIRCPEMDRFLQSCILGCHGNNTMSENNQVFAVLRSWLLWRSYDAQR